MNRVAVIMGSANDLDTLRGGVAVLDELGIDREVRVVSAHRTPVEMCQFAQQARSEGFAVIIAAAGGAAHLPGMVAAQTTLPVIGVRVPATALAGTDALLSIAQMPKGTPVATMAIGAPGAINAAVFAAQILAVHDADLAARLAARKEQARQTVVAQELDV